MTVTQKPSLSSIATDPLRNFKFQVLITPGSGGRPMPFGFMNVQGLNVQVDVIAYREGAYNVTTQKMPGQADFSPIVLSHGVQVGAQEDVSWLQELFLVMQGTGQYPAGYNFRSTVDIQILDHPNTSSTAYIKAWYRVYNAWPTAVSWSDLDAGASALLISQMSLAHEGFDVLVASSAGASEVSF